MGKQDINKNSNVVKLAQFLQEPAKLIDGRYPNPEVFLQKGYEMYFNKMTTEEQNAISVFFINMMSLDIMIGLDTIDLNDQLVEDHMAIWAGQPFYTMAKNLFEDAGWEEAD